MSKPTLILIIFLILLTIGLFVLAINKSSNSPKVAYLSPTPSIEIKKPNTPETSLLFGDLQVVPSSDSAKISSSAAKTTSGSLTSSDLAKTYSLPIVIKTGTNKVTAVQLELSFDPKVITNVNIKPSNFFVNPLIFVNGINSNSGRISYALGSARSEKGKQGKQTVAIFTFQLKAASDRVRRGDVTKIPTQEQTYIYFLPKTFVAAEGLQQSALKSTNSAQINVGM